MVERYLAKVNVAGSSLVSRSKTKHTPCGCVFVLRNRIQTRLEGGAASGSEHFARPRYSPAPLHGKTNSTVCCLAGRDAKGASLVSRSKTKHTPCGCVFVLRNRIQTRLEGGVASGSEHFARPRYSPASLHGKTNSTVCCLAGPPPFSMAPLCKGSCQRQLTEGLCGVSLHFFGEKM